MEFLDEILNLPYEEKMKLVALLWCWWTERNKSNHGELLNGQSFLRSNQLKDNQGIQFGYRHLWNGSKSI
jgi:hypothetical protein